MKKWLGLMIVLIFVLPQGNIFAESLPKASHQSEFSAPQAMPKVKWSVPFPNVTDMLIDNQGIIYAIAAMDQKITAISPDGKVLWQQNVDHWMGATALLGNAAIIIADTHEVVAISTADGEQLWKHEFEEDYLNGVAVDAAGHIVVSSNYINATKNGNDFVMSSSETRLYGLDSKGTLKWQTTLQKTKVDTSLHEIGDIVTGNYSPIIYQNRIYLLYASGKPAAISKIAFTTKYSSGTLAVLDLEGKILSRSNFSGAMGGLLVKNSRIYVSGGNNIYQYDKAGKLIRTIAFSDRQFLNALGNDGSFVSSDRYYSASGKSLWSVDLKVKGLGDVTIDKNNNLLMDVFYYRGNSGVAYIEYVDPKKKKTIWSFPVGIRNSSLVLGKDGVIYVGLQDKFIAIA